MARIAVVSDERAATGAGALSRTQTWLCSLDRVAGLSGASPISSGTDQKRSKRRGKLSQSAEKSLQFCQGMRTTGHSSFKQHDRKLLTQSALKRRAPTLPHERRAGPFVSGSARSHDDVCSQDFCEPQRRDFFSLHCMRANDAAVSAFRPSAKSASRCRFMVAAPNPSWRSK